MKPTSNLVDPLLTDLYELTAAHAFWKAGRHEDQAVFDLFFRKNPFGGEFTVFAGLEELLRFISEFRFDDQQIALVRRIVPNCDPGFYHWLRQVDCSRLTIRAVPEGTVVFPYLPLLTVEGPLAVAQMIEATLLVLVNYPSLVATNAARMRMAAGQGKSVVEFGLRRAQGPDGALSASRYAYVGGCDGTSNVKASQVFDLPARGTQMHAFVLSFSSLADLNETTIVTPDGKRAEFVAPVLSYREQLGSEGNEGELAAFIAYAQAFPKGFLALVDTYDTLKSGVPNFLAVALALRDLGYQPLGIRLDSGDLAFLSRESRNAFRRVDERWDSNFAGLTIVASNDLDEDTLLSLGHQGHEVDVFGIGTRLVTCYAQPALGCIYKLVEVRGQPRIKISQELAKVTIPGAKNAYRLVGAAGFPLLDLLTHAGEPPPIPGKRVLCRHPFDETKRAYVTPTSVIPLYETVWNGELTAPFPRLDDLRARVNAQLGALRPDHLRTLNPTPYKVSLSEELYDFMHRLWLEEAPVSDLR